MRPVETVETTHFYHPPENWNHDAVPMGNLPVTKSTAKDSDIPLCVSYWLPSPEDLEMLNKGGVLAVAIVGTEQPGMNVMAFGAFSVQPELETEQ